MRANKRDTTTLGEAAAIAGICFGYSIILSTYAVASGFPDRGFSNSGFVWAAGTELVMTAAALGVLYVRGYAIASLLPTPTFKDSVAGVVLFFAGWAAGWLLTMPFAAAPEQPIARMMDGATVTMPTIVLFAMVNGTYEEVFLLGFLMRGLRHFGLSIALGVMLLVRVLYHLYQGPLGALWVLGVGVVFGLYFARTNRLWPLVFAHILWDIVPFLSG
jgi:membrane protease YdiL (CAAX protease family)